MRKGVALELSGEREEAIERFKLGFRYALPDSLEVAAGAMLYVASALLELGQRDQAHDFMTPHVEKFANCPEFIILLARTEDGDGTSLDEGFRIAPELAIGAVLVGAPGAEAAAERVASEGDSVVDDARDFVSALSILVSSVQELAPLRLTELEAQLSSSHSGDLLTAAAAVLDAAPAIVAEAKREVTPEMIERPTFGFASTDWLSGDVGNPSTLRAVKESRGMALAKMGQIAEWPFERLYPWRVPA